MSPSKSASVWPILLLFLVLPYFRHETPNGFSDDELATLHLASAIVEQQSVRIGEQVKRRGDTAAKVMVDGDAYSAVAPGLGFIAVPFYGIAKGVTWMTGSELSARGAIRWLRLILVQLPTAIFALVFFAFLVRRGVHAHAARLGVLFMALAYPLIAASTTLSGAYVAALCVLGCFVLLGNETDWPQQPSFVMAGLLLAIAVLTCHVAIFVLPLLAVYGLGRARNPRWLVPFFLLGLAGVIGLGAYHFVCFGSPFFVSHAAGEQATFWGLHAPGLTRIFRAFIAPAGVVQMAPVLAVAAIGFVFMLGRGDGGESAISAIAAVLALLFAADGDGVVFALVLCTWPLARGIEAMTSVAGGALVVGVLGAWSLIITALLSATHVYPPAEFANPLRDVSWVMFQEGVFEQGVGHLLGLSGYFAIAPFALLMFAVTCVCATGGNTLSESGGFSRVLSVIAIAAALFVWQLSWRVDPHARENYLYTQKIMQRLEAGRSRPDSRIARAAARARDQAPGARETLIINGHAATASGENPAALDAYRQLPPP